MLIIIANVGRASGNAVDAVGWAAVVHRFPGETVNTITTAGIAADAAATAATAAATAASNVAGATDTTAAPSHVQAVALFRLHSGFSILGQYLCSSDYRGELWGDNRSRIRDPGNVGVG